MSAIETSDLAASTGPAGRSLFSDAARRIGRDKLALVCLAIIAIYTLIAIFTPLMFPHWAQHDYSIRSLPPSWAHLLGTDVFGRSVLIKTLLGAHVSMTVAFFAMLIAIPTGMFIGALAGYYGGWVDDVIVWLYTTLASIPGIVQLIVLMFVFKGRSIFGIQLEGMVGLCLVLAIMSWVGTCRLVRAETLKLRELDYVIAARAAGRRPLAILLTHILPNVVHIGIINFSLGFVGAIMFEVILSYLGLGVANMPSWGKMINDARMDLVIGRYWELGAAVVAMFIIVLAWNLLGDRLRDALDPKLRNV